MGKYIVVKSSKIKSLAKEIGKNTKDSRKIIEGENKEYMAVLVVTDGVKNKAEAHSNKRDVQYVVSGKGIFKIGGEFINPQSPKENEWVGDGLEGGETFEISEGDIIDIAPGIPHQLDATGSRIEILLIKLPF